jgi:hypothetical protein
VIFGLTCVISGLLPFWRVDEKENKTMINFWRVDEKENKTAINFEILFLLHSAFSMPDLSQNKYRGPEYMVDMTISDWAHPSSCRDKKKRTFEFL